MTKSVASSKGSSWGETSLPTTVGLINHDPTLPRAPGYSFGCRYTEKPRPTPGPQYMVEGGLTPRGSDFRPSYSIAGRPRRSLWLPGTDNTPGPNAYNLSSGAAPWERRAPVYSIGVPYRNNYRRDGPAPNSYMLPTTLGTHVPTMRAAPAAAIHGRGSENKGFSYDSSKTPGPAAYSVTDISHTTRRAPAITMKGRAKEPTTKTVFPGPGAYDPGNGSNVTKSSPRFYIGIRHGDKVQPMFTMADVSD